MSCVTLIFIGMCRGLFFVFIDLRREVAVRFVVDFLVLSDLSD